MPPERTNLVLASHIPDSEGNVLVLHSLNVETLGWRATSAGSRVFGGRALTDGWDGGHDLSQLQLVQNGGFTGSIQSNLPYC